MQNPTGLRLLLLLSPAIFLLLPLSALIFILERISQSLLNTHLTRSYRSGAGQISLTIPSSGASSNATDVTIDVNPGPSLAILGVSVIAFIAGILACCATWELRRVQGAPGLQRFWAWVGYIGSAITLSLSVGVLAWASAVQSREAWTSADDAVSPGTREFTRETWVCQIAKFFPKEKEWAVAACGVAQATRYLLIGVALAAVGVAVSVWVLVRRRGGVGWLFGGKGRYAGFKSVYEMGPHAHAPAPVYQPPPQFYPQSPGPQQYGPGQYQMPQYQMPQPYPPQQWQPHPPTQLQPAPPAAKDASTTDARAVF
jgi:hypothetical protein